MCGRTLIAGLGAVLIFTFFAMGPFGSVRPATAQDGAAVGIFAYNDRSAEHAKHYIRHAVRRSRPRPSDDLAADNTADKKEKKEEAKKGATKGAVYAIVSVANQRVTVYDATGSIGQSRVSTGMRGHPTPIGLFTIIGKERWHRSNIYSGAPMPFMQRITWSGVAMHLGVVPGHPASHGCVRLPEGFAQKFWQMTQIGSRVVIARNDTIAVGITSPLLPVPTLQPAPKELSSNQQTSLPSPGTVTLASFNDASPAIALATQEPQSTPTTASKLLNPIEYAKALKERALTSEAVADRAAKDALLAAKAAGAFERQNVDGISSQISDPLPPVIGGLSGADVSAQANLAVAAGSFQARTRAALLEARSREVAKRQAAFAAIQTWKDAVAAGKIAADAVKVAERRLKPVSVLFSKKEGRVFIRQDWKEVYEAPITFKNPDSPVGTHLFIAVDGDANGKVIWSAISVPSGATPSDDLPRKRLKNDKSADPMPPQGATALAAVDRINVPDDVRARIAELVWVGAEIIVTDNARSDEMDSDSDFIVSTR